MNELQIAKEKVLPYIEKTLRWPENLVSNYGRVPVQMGTDTKWADIVCYIYHQGALVPWIVFEVKDGRGDLKQAEPQAESYSLLLDAPFFCLTDGVDYQYYVTGKAQGKSVLLEGLSLTPSGALIDLEPQLNLPPRMDELIELFVKDLKSNPRLFDDTKEHDDCAARLHTMLFGQIDKLTADEIKNLINDNIMMRTPNKTMIFNELDTDKGLDKFKNVLRYIKDKDEDLLIKLNTLLMDSEYAMKGAGLFFITQLLAGSKPDQYVALQDNVSYALKDLGVIDVIVKSDVANGYIFVNNICLRLYQSRMKKALERNGFSFGLAAVHNFLWHYYAYYRVNKTWY